MSDWTLKDARERDTLLDWDSYDPSIFDSHETDIHHLLALVDRLEGALRDVLNSDMAQMAEDEGRVNNALARVRAALASLEDTQ